MNELQAYISDCGGVAAFAAKHGITDSYVYQILRGEKQFGRKKAEEIEIGSGGRVSKVALVFGEDSAA